MLMCVNNVADGSRSADRNTEVDDAKEHDGADPRVLQLRRDTNSERYNVSLINAGQRQRAYPQPKNPIAPKTA